MFAKDSQYTLARQNC